MNKSISNELTRELVLAGRFLRHQQGRPRGQENILKLLAEKEMVSQKQLQEELEVRPGSISEITAKLERHGLINRTRSNEDSRAVVLSLSEKGKDRVKELEELKEEDLYTSLDDEEKQKLKEILMKLNNDWIRRGPIEPPHHERHCRMHKGPEHHMMHHGPRGPRLMMDLSHFSKIDDLGPYNSFNSDTGLKDDEKEHE